MNATERQIAQLEEARERGDKLAIAVLEAKLGIRDRRFRDQPDRRIFTARLPHR